MELKGISINSHSEAAGRRICFLRCLKIRVSVVRFRPWPPTFSGLALSNLLCVRQRRENVELFLRFSQARPIQSGPQQPLNAQLQTWRSDPPSRATSSRPDGDSSEV